MSTDPQTAEQSKTGWVATQDGYIAVPAADVQLVKVTTTGNGEYATSNLLAAMQDPANVLHVSAYPEVVEALEELLPVVTMVAGCLAANYQIAVEAARAALSHVHPAAEPPT